MPEKLFHFIAGGQQIQFKSPNVLDAWRKMERCAEAQCVPDEFKRLPILALDSDGAEIATRTWDDWHTTLIEDIDPGIRTYLEKLWGAGYATESSCSGMSCDHELVGIGVANETINGATYKIYIEGPSIIFTDVDQRQTESILFAARWSLGTAFVEEWFEARRAWVWWKFKSRWFYPWFLALPGRWQDLVYWMCLKIFAWLLVRRSKTEHPDRMIPIPKETRKIFEEFLLFLELNGPGPDLKTAEPSLSAEEWVELQMLERFLDESRVPEDLRKRIERRYIEEEFARRKKRGFLTWALRSISVCTLVAGISYLWFSPQKFPALFIVISSALFFWVGEKIADARYEVRILRLFSVFLLVTGIVMYWSSPKEFPPFMAPFTVIVSALLFQFGEKVKH